jgi:UDP:flavonoid glycosyltransferase YjiC (YdhE family)
MGGQGQDHGDSMECGSGSNDGARHHEQHHEQQQQQQQQQRVVVVALGSRGDVQPLAIIAERIARRGEVAVSLVSHGELLWLCEQIAPGADQRPLKASCFLGDKHDLENPLCVVDTSGRRRAEWVQVCEAARDADLIVSNLFGMPPCIHLAEKLGVALLVCSPSLVPYVLPTNFDCEFRGEFPEIYEHISGGKSCVSWDAVLEWMWPIFTEAHGALREHLLHLPNIPFLAGASSSSSSSISSKKNHTMKEEEEDDDDLAAAVADPWVVAPRLFIGIDDVLLRHARLEGVSEAGWGLPTSATVCAPWELSDTGKEPTPPGEWPFEEGERPVFVTFGSMGRHELLEDAQSILERISEALSCCGARGAVQWPTSSAGAEGGESRSWPQNLVHVSDDISYPWAFGRCRAVLHHGGIGTTSECIKAGVPQVVFPIAFDQRFWGKVVERAGVGACAGDVGEIRGALQKALCGDVVERAQSCKRRVSEDGEDLVCMAVIEHLSMKYDDDDDNNARSRDNRWNRWRRDKRLDFREPVNVKTINKPPKIKIRHLKQLCLLPFGTCTLS